MSIEAVVQRLSEVQRKIENLKSLLVDPDLAEYVRALSANGTSPIRAEAHKSPPSARKPEGLKWTLHATPLPEFFTVAQAVKALTDAKFDFKGRDPNRAVLDCLYVSARKQSGFRLARKAQGGEPNMYAKIL